MTSSSFTQKERILYRFDPKEAAKTHELLTIKLYKSGQVAFSQSFTQLLDLKPGDCLTFFSDKNRPQDWFVAKDESNGAFELRIHGGQLSFCSKSLCLEIAKSTGEGIVQNFPLKFLIGAEPIREGLIIYPIITANNLAKRPRKS